MGNGTKKNTSKTEQQNINLITKTAARIAESKTTVSSKVNSEQPISRTRMYKVYAQNVAQQSK